MRACLSLLVVLVLAAAMPASACSDPDAITAEERGVILAYFAEPPPAFSEVKPLPPAVARKLMVGRPLPPGIARRYLPQDLVDLLPPHPGYQWLLVGTNVVVLVVKTGKVHEILRDVINP